MRKIISGIFILIIGALLWYLFIKPSDYTVRFTANTFPGTINQFLKRWEKSLETEAKIRQDGDLYHLEHKLKFGDSVHRYQWSINPLTDSTSRVVVNISDENHSLGNKIAVPFSDTDFEKRSRKTVLEFMEDLQEHTEQFKVTIVGEDEFPTKYVAYIPLKTAQSQKAGGMMKHLSYLMGELKDRGVQFDGVPMLEVTQWDQDQDSIQFNLGRPIIRSEKLPIGTEIQYKRIFRKKALKAEYNGNYITSDRAWYALLDYAEKNDIEVEPNPIEVFYNDPHTDGGELTWKAEIYLPIKEKQG